MEGRVRYYIGGQVVLQRIRSHPPIKYMSCKYLNLLIDTFKYLYTNVLIMAKPVRVNVDRDEYAELVKRFGNDGVRPAECELVHRALNHIHDLESELAQINAVLQEGTQ